MSKLRVAISPSSFAEVDASPIQILDKAGIEIINNKFHRRLTEQEIKEMLMDVDGLIAGLEPLTRNVLAASPKLKVISRVGIGIDNIDLEAAEEFNIKILNTPNAPTLAVAEMCLTVLLSLSRNLIRSNQDMHSGIWEKIIGSSIQSKRILLIGYGRIGRKFGELLMKLNAEVLVFDPIATEESLMHGEKLVSLSTGLAQADVVSLHASGRNVILNHDAFKEMKRGMLILNSARAELIDEIAFVDALNNGVVAKAWMDTFWDEPYSGKLIEYEQVLLTPHICTYTADCRSDMETNAVINLLKEFNLDKKL